MNHALLEGKTALVTGGTAGIGKGIVALFATHGANVVFCGRNAAKGAEVAQEVCAAAGRPDAATFVQADVADPKAMEDLVSHVLEKFKKLDILVNNAGITRDGLLMRMSEEQWDEVISVNLKSVYSTCRAAIRPMLKERCGSIINISSVVGLTGNAGQANYAAAKSGILGFTKSLAQEVASRQIKVNCICPGFVDTSMTGALNDVQRESILKKIPMGTMGVPQDIAYAALYLASDWSRYMTGQVLTVDGGMVM